MRNGAGAAALLILIAVVLALSLGSSRRDSATSDEPAHIANGVIRVTERWQNFFREQPALMNSMSAVPLVLAGYRIEPGWKGANHWIVGRRFLYRSGHDAYRILFLSRLPTIMLFGALVAVMYWFVLSQTGSPAWALAAAILTGFCPNLMAHGRLATVDMALTFFAFASTALLITLFGRPTLPLAMLFGLAAVAAPMTKVSGLILGPYFIAVIAAAFVLRHIPEPRRFFKGLAVAIVTGLVFFEAFGLAETGQTFAHQQYPATSRLAIPFVEYVENVRAINNWYTHGHALPQFLLGEFSTSGWPQYYPIAFLLKTPIPAIFLFVAAMVAGVRMRGFTFSALAAFVVLFFAIAAAGRLALGIRYVLPVYPFIYAATPIALHASKLRRGGLVLVAVLLAWHAAENLRAYPSYIAYFNELTGGEANADKFLIDSNLDWGQDLRRLDDWARTNHVRQIAVHYFGGGSVEYEIRSAKPIILYAPGPGLLPPGYFALSRHFYRVSFDPDVWGVNYDDYLAASHAVYVGSVGGSINIYRVGVPIH